MRPASREAVKVVVVGGGWGGCAAALSAVKQGGDVTLIERADMLLGTGLVGGIFRNNGRFTAAEEALAMGGGEMFEVMDANALHRDIEFPGHKHASLYNVDTIEPDTVRVLERHGVQIRLTTRITDVVKDGDRVMAVVTAKDASQERFEGDVFVDATGTAALPNACNKYGNGCAMCVMRCHAFGARVSVAARAGAIEMIGKKGNRIGAMSGSCDLVKESLAPDLVAELDRRGVVVRKVPNADSAGSDKLAIKACQQYALPEYQANVVVLDTGTAKLMTPFYELRELRKVPGFEKARFEDPYAGGVGNSIRYIGMAPRNDALQVSGIPNLFCCGEKAGLLVGHTEAVVTGMLAGYNAVRRARGEEVVVLPDTLAIGDAITFVREQMNGEQGLGMKFTFSGSVLFDRMEQRGSYTTDVAEIRRRVEAAGLTNLFAARKRSVPRSIGPVAA